MPKATPMANGIRLVNISDAVPRPNHSAPQR